MSACQYCKLKNHVTQFHICKICKCFGHNQKKCGLYNYYKTTEKLYDTFHKQKISIVIQNFLKDIVHIEFQEEKTKTVILMNNTKILTKEIRITVNFIYNIYMYEYYDAKLSFITMRAKKIHDILEEYYKDNKKYISWNGISFNDKWQIGKTIYTNFIGLLQCNNPFNCSTRNGSFQVKKPHIL